MSESEARRFQHKTLGFSLVPPEGWECAEGPEGATFTAPGTGAAGGNTPMLAVSVQNVSGSQATLAGFTATALDELGALQREKGTETSLGPLRPALLAGRKAYTVRYTLAGARVEQTWAVLAQPPVALVATATVPAGTPEPARRTALRAARTAVATLAATRVRCVPENLLGALVLAPARAFPAALAPLRLAVPPLWQPIKSDDDKNTATPQNTATASVSYEVHTPLAPGADAARFRVTASATRVGRGTTLDAWTRAGVARLRAWGAQDVLVVGACAADVGRPACVRLGACAAVTVRYTLPAARRAGVVVWALHGTARPRVFALSFVLEPSAGDDERPFAIFSRIVEHAVLPQEEEEEEKEEDKSSKESGVSEEWHVYEDLEVGMSMRFPACLVPTPHAEGCTVAFGAAADATAAPDAQTTSVAVVFQRVAQAPPPIADICASLRANVLQESGEHATVLEERLVAPDTCVVAYRLAGDSGQQQQQQQQTRRLVQYVRVADGVVVLVTVADTEERFVRMWLALRLDTLVHSIRKLED